MSKSDPDLSVAQVHDVDEYCVTRVGVGRAAVLTSAGPGPTAPVEFMQIHMRIVCLLDVDRKQAQTIASLPD